MEHLVLQAWHGLDVEPEDVQWLLTSGALVKLGCIVASRVPLSSSESDTADMEGLWEAAVTAYGKVVSRCISVGSAISAEADRTWALVLSRVAEGPVGDKRDARRLRVLTWMHASLSRFPGRYSASKNLLEQVLQIAHRPESPLLQRVALKCCELILPGSARSEVDTLLGPWVRDALSYIGSVLVVSSNQERQGMERANIDGGGSGGEGKSKSSSSASELEKVRGVMAKSSTEGHLWKVVVLPVLGRGKLTQEEEAAVEAACLKALTSNQKDGEGEGEGEEEAGTRVRRRGQQERAKEVARSIACGSEAFLHQSQSREECLSVSAALVTRDALSVVFRARPPTSDHGGTRWSSGNVKHSAAMDMLATLRFLSSCMPEDGEEPFAPEIVREEVSGSLKEGLSSMMSLREGKAAAESEETGRASKCLAGIHEAIGALELLCSGESDANIRAGCRIQIVGGVGNANPPVRPHSRGATTGRVVRVDAVTATLSYIPDEVLRSRSYQHWVPLIVPLHHARKLQDPGNARLFPQALVECCLAQVFSAVSGHRPGDGGVVERLSGHLQMRGIHALSWMLKRDPADVPRKAIASGLLPLLSEVASSPGGVGTGEGGERLEQKLDAITSLLCECTDGGSKSHPSLASRTSHPGGGGSSSSGGSQGDSGAGGGLGTGVGPGRGLRGLPIEPFVR